MVEHAEEHNDVEPPHPLGSDLRDVQIPLLDLRREDALGHVEPSFRSPTGTAPAEVVGSQDVTGPATCGLNAEEAIPGADIEH